MNRLNLFAVILSLLVFSGAKAGETSYCGPLHHESVDMGAPISFLFISSNSKFGEIALTGGSNAELSRKLENLQLPLGGNSRFCAYSDSKPRRWAFGTILQINRFTIVPWMPSL